MVKLSILQASDNHYLAQQVCDLLGIDLIDSSVKQFRDKDVTQDINESLRGHDTFIFQYYVPAYGSRLYELDLVLNGIGPSVRRKNVVFPFAFGSRAERRTKPRQPINSVVVAQNLNTKKTYGLLTLEIHTQSIGSIYDALNMCFDNLNFEDLAVYHTLNHLEYRGKLSVVSPDVGGLGRARNFEKILRTHSKLDLNLVVVDKYRPKPNVAKVTRLIGDVNGRDCLMYDDLVDTMGTLCSGAKLLKEKGAKRVYAIASHPVFSEAEYNKKGEIVEPGAKENLEEAFSKGYLDELIVSNTIPLKKFAEKNDKIRVINVAPLFEEAIKRIHKDQSISALHNYEGVVKLYKRVENLKGFLVK